VPQTDERTDGRTDRHPPSFCKPPTDGGQAHYKDTNEESKRLRDEMFAAWNVCDVDEENEREMLTSADVKPMSVIIELQNDDDVLFFADRGRRNHQLVRCHRTAQHVSK